MHALTEEWVLKAENDYYTALRAMDSTETEGPITDTACFHCQQCAEKYLRAFLTQHAVAFPREHPLIPLLELCLPLDESFEVLRRDLRHVDSYAVAVRYPGVNVSHEMAESALAAAERIRTLLRGKISLPNKPGA